MLPNELLSSSGTRGAGVDVCFSMFNRVPWASLARLMLSVKVRLRLVHCVQRSLARRLNCIQASVSATSPIYGHRSFLHILTRLERLFHPGNPLFTDEKKKKKRPVFPADHRQIPAIPPLCSVPQDFTTSRPHFCRRWGKQGVRIRWHGEGRNPRGVEGEEILCV